LLFSIRIEITPQPIFEDILITDVAKHLLAEVESGGAMGALYSESLMTALTARLIKNYSTARMVPYDYQGGLASAKLRLVIKYINEHLATENLSLELLAGICDLSIYHFSRLFKQSMGISPYQYVTQKRINRAKQLLKMSKQTISEIAQQCGFGDQAHLTTQFRKVTGVTPKVYRDRL
jgi:AraC family transcriptional regulator